MSDYQPTHETAPADQPRPAGVQAPPAGARAARNGLGTAAVTPNSRGASGTDAGSAASVMHPDEAPGQRRRGWGRWLVPVGVGLVAFLLGLGAGQSGADPTTTEEYQALQQQLNEAEERADEAEVGIDDAREAAADAQQQLNQQQAELEQQRAELQQQQAELEKRETDITAREEAVTKAEEEAAANDVSAPEPEPQPEPQGNEPWNMPGPDLDCADIGHQVTITGPDYHDLDRDGDGIACES
jgi:Tfp pilus assembly protein FimV